MQDSENNPLVSISCITFNHAAYIRRCLDGILMQKTSFSFEVLIHDDASQDGTEEIIREYEAKYPHIIKALYEEENQWVKGRRGSMVFNFPRAKGKYIAMCEGDDYWTDPLKLQDQVEFLEQHPEYVLACGGYTHKSDDLEEEVIVDEPRLFSDTHSLGFGFSLEDLHKKWLTKTLTSLFRKDVLVLEELSQYQYARDVHLFYHIMKKGRGVYFQRILGVYNVHEGGVKSMVGEKSYSASAYHLYKELYEVNRDAFSKKKLFYTLLRKLRFDMENVYQGNTLKSRLSLLSESFFLIASVDDAFYYCSHLLKFMYLGILPNKK